MTMDSGTCRVCLRRFRVTPTGRLYPHGDPTPRVWPPRRCAGAGLGPVRTWGDIEPEHAVNLTLPWTAPDGTIVEGPMNELGERCPWPWEPQQLKGAPLGQFHCGYCGGMQAAGIPHTEWTPEAIREMEDAMYGAAPEPPDLPEPLPGEDR